jgi:rare lipoprotein A
MGFRGISEPLPLVRAAVRLTALGLGCLTLANCSANMASRVDPRYGVLSSARVVEPGQDVPKGGGVYRVGAPYVIAGRTYVPQEDGHYSSVGLASWYGDDFHGRYTANGEIFDMNAITAAHPTLPLPSYVRVTNLRNQRSIIVRVNDRGPYVGNRVIDLSVRTAKLLDFYGQGVAKVKVEYVGRAPLAGSDDRKLEATLREGAPATGVQVASAQAFVPAVFDSRPLRQLGSAVPSPPERPYQIGEGARDVPAVTRRAPATMALADEPAEPVHSGAAPLTSPVSAYAPVRYDAGAAAMSGRGLY